MLSAWCKPCTKEKRRKRYWENIESSREKSREWKKSNPEKRREYGRKWRQAHPEKRREEVRKWGQSHKDQKNAYDRNWRLLNPDKAREAERRWKQANPKKTMEYNHAHRARKLGNGGKITPADFEELKKFYNYTCLDCERREPEIKLTLDHVIPLVLGGKNNIGNAQPLCKSCNSRKGIQIRDYRPKFSR